MKKMLLVALLIALGVFSSGCVMEKAGKDFVKGATDMAVEFAKNKNRAELDKAVSEGMGYGIMYQDIDTNCDGLFSDKEAMSYGLAMVKAKGKAELEGVIESLLNGDIKEAKAKAKEAGDDAVDWLEGLLAMVVVAGGTYKGVMWSRDRKYKDGSGNTNTT